MRTWVAGVIAVVIGSASGVALAIALVAAGVKNPAVVAGKGYAEQVHFLEPGRLDHDQAFVCLYDNDDLFFICKSLDSAHVESKNSNETDL